MILTYLSIHVLKLDVYIWLVFFISEPADMYNSESRYSMDGSQTATELDQEFDQFLAGMKPCVLRLPKKSGMMQV